LVKRAQNPWQKSRNAFTVSWPPTLCTYFLCTHSPLTDLTTAANTMEQNSWEPHSHTASQEIHCLSCHLKVHYCACKTHQWTLPWARWNQFIFSSRTFYYFSPTCALPPEWCLPKPACPQINLCAVHFIQYTLKPLTGTI
jgi:hypothetical protein